jgi:hypothetical protein
MRSHGTLNEKVRHVYTSDGQEGFPHMSRLVFTSVRTVAGGGFAQKQRDAALCQKATGSAPGDCFGRCGVIASQAATIGSSISARFSRFSILVWLLCSSQQARVVQQKQKERQAVERSSGPRHAVL